MSRKLAIAILLFLIATTVNASPFQRAVKAVEEDTGLRRIYIPFLGLARTFVRITGYEGVHDLRLAVFEGKRKNRSEEMPPFDKIAGPDWQKVMHSRSDREQTAIFARVEGDMMRMLVVTYETNEAVVVEMKIEPLRFAEFLEEQERDSQTRSLREHAPRTAAR